MPKYFISLSDPNHPHYFAEIEGEPITIEGFKAFHFFIHNPNGSAMENLWMVSEATTGLALTGWLPDQETAKRLAKEKLDGAGMERFKEVLEGDLKKTGRSPWEGGKSGK